ncbi:MAG: APC family permease [Candidatus Thorarchaeota archaeon]
MTETPTPESPTVFVRRASGLVRAWSPLDALIYNMVSCGTWGGVMVWILYYSPLLFPGASIPLSLAIAGVGFIPMFFVYSILATAMPRSGGDYVFISRGLHPALSFPVMMIYIFFTVSWNYWNGWGIANVGIAPTLTVAGLVSGNSAFFDMAAWVASDFGTVIIASIMVILTAVVVLLGMRFYAKLQRLLFLFVIISLGITLVTLGLTSSDVFKTQFDWFAQQVTGQTDMYDTIISTAQAGGFNPFAAFSMIGTLSMMGMAAGNLSYAYWGITNIGEIKSAGNLKLTTIQVVGASILITVVWVLLALVVVDTFTQPFLGALSYQFWNWTAIAQAFGSEPFLSTLVAILLPNPLFQGLLLFGALCSIYLYMPGILIGNTRYLFAMSFDRVLPSQIAYVDKRFNAPVVAIVLLTIVTEIWIILMTYVAGTGEWLTSVVFVTVAAQLLTCISGIVFPFRKSTKAIFESSPAAKWKLGPIPAISIFGFLGAIWEGYFIYLYLTIPELGMSSPASSALLLGIFIVGFIAYFVIRAYRKKQGIDIDLAYKEIPPA